MAIRVATVAGDPEIEARLAAQLGEADIEVFMRCMDRVSLLASIEVGALDAVLCIGSTTWLDRELAAEIDRAGVCLVGLAADPFETEHLLSLGATLVPVDAGPEQIIRVCSSWSPSEEGPRDREEGGSVVAVWGAKGSPGRTTVAIELASALSEKEPSTILVDADVYGGDVLQFLAVEEELPSIVWACRAALQSRLDESAMASHFRKVGRHGPVLIPGISRPELWSEISLEGWRALIGLLRSHFAFMVVDCGFLLEEGDPTDHRHGRDAVTVETIAQASWVIAVVRASPAGLKHFLNAYEHLARSADVEDVRIVLNHVRAGEEREIERLLKKRIGRRPAAVIGESSKAFGRALDVGRPLVEIAPRSELARTAKDLAGSLIKEPILPPRGLLSRLAGAKA